MFYIARRHIRHGRRCVSFVEISVLKFFFFSSALYYVSAYKYETYVCAFEKFSTVSHARRGGGVGGDDDDDLESYTFSAKVVAGRPPT